VGVGTASPEAKLHVFGTATADVTVGVGPNPDNNPPGESSLNFGYGGNTFGRGAGFFNIRPDTSAAAPNPSIRFLVANTERMIIDNQGFLGLGGVANPANPIEHTNGAFLSAVGLWTNGSSRKLKTGIQDLALKDAKDTLKGLTPVTFAYKLAPSERHVGFIAEDVPDMVAMPGRTGLSPMDIVAVLTRVVQDQQKAITELRAKVAALEAARKK
jgi:Chaperone of endosialidase